MSATPQVSVLLPVRNAARWLDQALDSLWCQRLEDFEVIALEDGSDDGSAQLLARCADARLRVVPTGGVGMGHALNRGLALARAPFIARHDADDLSHPDRLWLQAAYLREHADVDVVASVAAYVDHEGAPVDSAWVREVRRTHDAALTPEALARLLPVTCCLTHGSVMARRDVLRRAGGYRPECWPADDYDLWLRLLAEHRFAKLPAALYTYRLHAAQLGEGSKDPQTRQAILAKLAWLRRTEPDLPVHPRLAAEGSARGNDWYARMAPLAGWRHVAPDDDWDVLAITDFERLDALAHAYLGRCGGRIRGNFIVRALGAGHQGASA